MGNSLKKNFVIKHRGAEEGKPKITYQNLRNARERNLTDWRGYEQPDYEGFTPLLCKHHVKAFDFLREKWDLALGLDFFNTPMSGGASSGSLLLLTVKTGTSTITRPQPTDTSTMQTANSSITAMPSKVARMCFHWPPQLTPHHPSGSPWGSPIHSDLPTGSTLIATGKINSSNPWL